ncbi:MAG: hypothetical protein VR64_01025 [Desulfatitalea sp. BRH_c12]|nr:MAG: hypothetical protein VR64_01025 [Desulfatitalea sp. BRH_c12]
MKEESSDASFEAFFKRQILLNEGFRSTAILIVVCGLMAYLGITLLFYWDHYQRIQNQWRAFGWLTFLLLVVFIRTLNIRRLIRKWVVQGRQIKPVYQFINTLVEVSLPTVATLVIAHFYNETVALQSLTVLIYFLVISLTMLQLDFRISVFAGFLAAGEYLILAARIEQLNKQFGSRLLVSREVIDEVAPTQWTVAPLGLVHIKGRSEPMEIFKLA